MKKLEGKVALVTGATSGIGLATAKRFVEEGAFVFITGRRQAVLDDAVKAIGSNVIGIQADSSSIDDLNRVYETIKQEKGHLDVLYVNAGGGSMLPLGSITEEQYDDTFNRNVKGVVFTVQNALPILSEKASIILAGSTTSVKGTAAFSVYSATKAAVRNFARSWIIDLKDRGVRVNTLSPGPIKTPGLLDLAGPDAENQQGLVDYFASQVPLGRVGDPDEIAKTAVFLASDDASFINGVELFVDGGLAQI